jgi:two-component system nitrate/nitrite response regulator NarL
MFGFCGNRASTRLLVQALSHAHPNIVLMSDALLRHRGLAELAQLHRALPEARTILVGDSLDLTDISSAVRLGTWGVLAGLRVTADLERALRAVAGGELWFSRQQLSRLMMLTSVELSDDLGILTPRENAVMHKALLGHSNKEIASALSIAEQTVKIHLQHVYGKLHVHSRIELLLSFLRNGAVPYAR